MKKIYKFKVDFYVSQELILPAGSKILSVANQNEGIVLYALVNTESLYKQTYKIIMHGTGHAADDLDHTEFVGTVLLHEGNLVFHVFVERYETTSL